MQDEMTEKISGLEEPAFTKRQTFVQKTGEFAQHPIEFFESAISGAVEG